MLCVLLITLLLWKVKRLVPVSWLPTPVGLTYLSYVSTQSLYIHNLMATLCSLFVLGGFFVSIRGSCRVNDSDVFPFTLIVKGFQICTQKKREFAKKNDNESQKYKSNEPLTKKKKTQKTSTSITQLLQTDLQPSVFAMVDATFLTWLTGLQAPTFKLSTVVE